MVAVVLIGILVPCQNKRGWLRWAFRRSFRHFTAMLRTAHPAGMYTRALAPVR